MMFRTKTKKEYLKYSFIDNSILLTTETINRNGFYEIWRQENDQHSIQILCYNPEKEEFQAFDRFHRMNDPIYDGFTGGYFYEPELWTPIKLHYTLEWLLGHAKKRKAYV